MTSAYGIFDAEGRQLAAVQQGRQGMIRRRLEIADQQGRTLMRLVRPIDVFAWHLAVTSPEGASVGRFTAHIALGLRLIIVSKGHRLGELRAEGRTRTRFTITDGHPEPVARLEREREGMTSFRYTLHLHRSVPDPLRTLLVAAPFAVDLRFKELTRRAVAS
jgi:uncharacterized protein YxjI